MIKLALMDLCAAARAAMHRVRRLLGPHFGLADLA